MPNKRFLIIVPIVAVVGMGGYAAWHLIQQAQKQQAYEASPDKVADDFIRAFAAQDVKSAMQLFSRDLRASFSEA